MSRANRNIIQVSAEALTAMIGGNTEIEIEIRNSIVQEFARKHLKVIANSEVISKEFAGIRQDLSILLAEKCSEFFSRRDFLSKWEPNQQTKNLIDVTVRQKMEELIDKAITTRLDTINLADLIRLQMDTNIKSRIKMGVEAGITNFLKTVTDSVDKTKI